MDFSKKNNELKQTRQPAKIFLHNSVLLKITGGNAEISMDNNIHTDVKIDTGMILYIEKGTSISFRHMKSNHNDSVKVIELEECLLRNILPIISHLSFNGFTESPVNVKKYFLTKERKYASHIFDEFNGLRINESDTLYKEMLNSIYYMLSFFTCLPGFLASLERSMKNSFSEKIYKMIISDVSKKWTLQACAMELHTSVSTLKRKLDAEGRSFRKIYLDARMSVSLNLLRTTTKNISTIAIECGFNSCSNFSTTFGKYYGVTPKKVSKNKSASL
ncbi:TPA: helix-turn-helix domain-containing protein [Salmonella enterica]|uniref:Helix-turn-helix domain-containing protein n=1 Tax=Salmonella enterica TaxID=28901 RepID=A0A759QM22_SALER|nr:helix-turn-helix domain-containing protein [Salmonella enterica]HAK0844907.1 helix-turn-helix domain-containing protein [Salmonella enterica]HEC9709706.1 helix-turn-helix domain-containing protein [Salmonella enterica subsp. enterica serovar Muenchen]